MAAANSWHTPPLTAVGPHHHHGLQLLTKLFFSLSKQVWCKLQVRYIHFWQINGNRWPSKSHHCPHLPEIVVHCASYKEGSCFLLLLNFVKEVQAWDCHNHHHHCCYIQRKRKKRWHCAKVWENGSTVPPQVLSGDSHGSTKVNFVEIYGGAPLRGLLWKLI